jgi:hypothetical protein
MRLLAIAQVTNIQGRKRISMYVERLNPDQINMAELENFLLVNNFSVECKLLYAAAGRAFLSRKDLVKSLSFYAEAKNAARVFSVVNSFLESDPQLSDYENILAPINGSTLVSYDALVFLSRYRDFLKYRESGSLKEAGKYLSNLFLSGSIPKEFWKHTFADVEFLLDNECIDEAGCLELLRILEDERQMTEPVSRLVSLRSKLVHQLAIAH